MNSRARARRAEERAPAAAHAAAKRYRRWDVAIEELTSSSLSARLTGARSARSFRAPGGAQARRNGGAHVEPDPFGGSAVRVCRRLSRNAVDRGRRPRRRARQRPRPARGEQPASDRRRPRRQPLGSRGRRRDRAHRAERRAPRDLRRGHGRHRGDRRRHHAGPRRRHVVRAGHERHHRTPCSGRRRNALHHRHHRGCGHDVDRCRARREPVVHRECRQPHRADHSGAAW